MPLFQNRDSGRSKASLVGLPKSKVSRIEKFGIRTTCYDELVHMRPLATIVNMLVAHPPGRLKRDLTPATVFISFWELLPRTRAWLVVADQAIIVE